MHATIKSIAVCAVNQGGGRPTGGPQSNINLRLTMSCTTLVLETILATPARGQHRVTPSIRAALLSTLFDNV
ncbi:hypothetical protein, partial [Paraburkholderia hospita]|uniref:hypothetical protein n=1 Tax=Paraburkholderia hospita TaxID=169430 RepID=UPI0010547D64